MYPTIIFTILISFGLQASNREKWEVYPFVQRKIDEILEKTGRQNHEDNKLFAVFSLREQNLYLKCIYGSDWNKPFIDIVENEEYQIITNNTVDPLVNEIQKYLAVNIPLSEKKRFIDACKKNENGVHIDGFRRLTIQDEDQARNNAIMKFRKMIGM